MFLRLVHSPADDDEAMLSAAESVRAINSILFALDKNRSVYPQLEPIVLPYVYIYIYRTHTHTERERERERERSGLSGLLELLGLLILFILFCSRVYIYIYTYIYLLMIGTWTSYIAKRAWNSMRTY